MFLYVFQQLREKLFNLPKYPCGGYVHKCVFFFAVIQPSKVGAKMEENPRHKKFQFDSKQPLHSFVENEKTVKSRL